MKQLYPIDCWLSAHLLRRSVLALLITLCSCSILLAQESKEEEPTPFGMWVDGGLGFGTPNAVALNVGLITQINRVVVSFRGTTVVQIFGGFFSDTRMTFGWVFKADKLFLSCGTGIALTNGAHKNGLFSKEIDIPSTIGLPIDMRVSLRLTSFFGLGLYGFANINSEQFFSGVTLNVEIGKFVMDSEG